ncbi:MAG: Holliday junction branch migration protein RuvA [Pseudomonadota bacterium]
MIIGRLRGEVAAIGADTVLIDVAGVGYVAQAGSRALARLSVGQDASLHIETKVTENSITLYGFDTDEARAWFVRLQDVPGVGGKAAMAVLDALTVAELMDAIALGDVAIVTRAKGVGRKLAERIVGELSGKPAPLGRYAATPISLGQAASEPGLDAQTGARQDAIDALQALGYDPADAARAVATASKDGAGDDGPALIKAALKTLAPA